MIFRWIRLIWRMYVCGGSPTHRQMKSKSSIDCTARVCIPQTMAFVVLLNNCWYLAASAGVATVDDWRRTAPKEIFVVNLGIFGLTTLVSGVRVFECLCERFWFWFLIVFFFWFVYFRFDTVDWFLLCVCVCAVRNRILFMLIRKWIYVVEFDIR